MSDDIKLIGIVGAGQMGLGIAQVLATSGFNVLINDRDQITLNNASNIIKDNINNAINTQIPMKTLFWALMCRPTTPINMINPRNIKKDTNVRPEKKPSAINETKIKISISKMKANVFHLCSRTALKKKFSSCSSSAKSFPSIDSFFGN